MIGGADVSAEVAEGDVEVGVGVEVGEGEDVVVVERWLGRVDGGGFGYFDLHCGDYGWWDWWLKVVVFLVVFIAL